MKFSLTYLFFWLEVGLCFCVEVGGWVVSSDQYTWNEWKNLQFILKGVIFVQNLYSII